MASSLPRVWPSEGYEDESILILGRAWYVNASFAKTYVVRSDVSTVTYAVFDTTDETETDSGTLANTSILTALNTGNIWTVDTTGFNVAAKIPADAFPEGDRTYRVELIITLTDNARIPCFVAHSTINALGS